MRKYLRLILALSLLVMLLGCSKLTKGNYAKISTGMEYADLVKILGKPDSCSEAPFVKSCVWGSEKKNISVKFMNNKVLFFTSNNIK